MAKCECGCGKDTGYGQFLPGHDQRLRTLLEADVGGLLPMRTLIRATQAYIDGSIDANSYTRTVRSIFSGKAQTRVGAKTCRDEILECAKDVLEKSNSDHFTIPEII